MRSAKNAVRTFAAASAIAVVATSPAFADTRIFLEVPGIEGDAQVVGFERQIELQAVSLGLVSPGRRPCVAQDVSLTKFIDQATADLIAATAGGRSFPTVKLTFVNLASGGAVAPTIQFTFSDARFSSYQAGGSGGQPSLFESASINFRNLTGTVFIRNAGGSVTQEPFAASCN